MLLTKAKKVKIDIFNNIDGDAEELESKFLSNSE
jgi:hypothetical protein